MLHPNEIFNISKNKISAKEQCIISIDEKEYDDRTYIEGSKIITLPGILQFYVPKYEDYVQISLTYPIDLWKTSNTFREKNEITITYDEGDMVISKDYVPDEVDIGLLIRLLQGRIKYVKDPKILLNMIHDILPAIDLVHLELIVSNMFREENDLNKKCRLTGNYNTCTILGQERQPFQDSWASSMAFQYIDRAITSGLIGNKDAEQNPIEKVLNEDFKLL